MSIYDHTQLRVYQHAFDLAIAVHKAASAFPREERHRLTDQIIRCSRSPCAVLAEGWRKRRYTPQFVNKILDAEAEAAETRVWLQFAHALGYLDQQSFKSLDSGYNHLLSELVHTRMTAPKWANFKPVTRARSLQAKGAK